MPDPEGARSASPGLLESNPWRRLTISEHRGHLLPDTEDISAARRGHSRTACRQAATHLPVAEIATFSPVTSGCRQLSSGGSRRLGPEPAGG
jgi:hypothetical protein